VAEEEAYAIREGMVLELGRAMGYERESILERVGELGLLKVWDDYLTMIWSLRVREGGLERARQANEKLLRERRPDLGAVDATTPRGWWVPRGVWSWISVVRVLRRLERHQPVTLFPATDGDRTRWG
jgi:hypothetical protein